jgi:integrase
VCEADLENAPYRHLIPGVTADIAMGRLARPWFRKATGTWWATLGGRKVSLKVRGAANRAAAERAYRELLNAGQPGNGIPARAVATLAAAYLADCRPRMEANTYRVYAAWLKDLSASAVGRRPAADLTPAAVEAWARRDSWSTTTRAAALTCIHTFIRWCIRGRLLGPADPLAGLRVPPRSSRGASAVIDPDEYAAVLRVATPQFALLLTVLWETGARPSEICRATAADCDWDAGTVTLAAHKQRHKTGRPRVIFLTDTAAGILRDAAGRNPTGALLRNTLGRPWTPGSAKQAIRAAARRAELGRRITLYFFRHSLATRLIVAGVPDGHVGAILGHAGTATLWRHYCHLLSRPDVLRAALNGRPE